MSFQLVQVGGYHTTNKHQPKDMPPVTQTTAAVAPLGVAAVLLAARTLGAGLGLDGLPSADTVLEATGVGRSRAYELASQVPEAGPSHHKLDHFDHLERSLKKGLVQHERKQEKARATRESRQRPEVRDLLDEAFERLGLLDPERHIRLAIARYPLDAIVDAIAIFEAKRERGSLPDDADARYLLGIVRNVDTEREQQLLADTLLFWRTRARDHALLTLEKQLQQLTTTDRPARDVIADCSTHALLDDRRIDRDFWRDALVRFIAEQPEHERLPLYQSACRRIRTTYRAAPRDRQGLICALARAVKPTL